LRRIVSWADLSLAEHAVCAAVMEAALVNERRVAASVVDDLLVTHLASPFHRRLCTQAAASAFINRLQPEIDPFIYGPVTIERAITVFRHST